MTGTAPSRFSRSPLAALIRPTRGDQTATAAELDTSAIHLTLPSGQTSIPLQTVLSVQDLPRFPWHDVAVLHGQTQTILAGFSARRAKRLADAIQAQRLQWWTATLQRQSKAIADLHARLAQLARASGFTTRTTADRLLQDAIHAARPFPPHLPDMLHRFPEIPLLRDLLHFIREPDLFREHANRVFISRELAASRDLLDTVEAHPLTDEQRRSIVIDAPRNLVIAPAGSGKTSVLVAKTAWLLHRRHVPPSSLLLLAFARDARKEMETRVHERLRDETAHSIAVQTFHSLGLSIIARSEKTHPKLSPIADDHGGLALMMRDLLAQLIHDSRVSPLLLEWLQHRFAPYRPQHDFASWGAYWNHIRRHDVRSLAGEKVKTLEQCEIANFLFLHSIPYEYDTPYQHAPSAAGRNQYRPNFHIPDQDIYIEHFALDAAGHTPPFIDPRDYQRSMQWKRELHREHETTLIETYTHHAANGSLRETLAASLQAQGIALSPVPPETIFAVFAEQGRIEPLANLLATFLRHYKGARLTPGDLSERAAAAHDPQRAASFVAIFEHVLSLYADTLAERGEIDFHDMINTAADHVLAGNYPIPYRYILVDEFQDISRSRARLLSALIERNPQARLFAVGDDWQAIYRFAGSDISIMREFEATFGETEQIPLETTFRCPDGIAFPAARFVLQNPAQIRRDVHSAVGPTGTAIHIGLERPDSPLLPATLEKIALDAASRKGSSTVLILARYRRELPRASTLQPKYPDLRLSSRTIHAAKGMEADYVILLGLRSGKFGFPTEISDDPLLDLVLATPEPYPDAEERRLLYVALTRARRRIYLITNVHSPSRFTAELLHGDYDVETFGNRAEPPVPCPECTEGRLQLHSNARNNTAFYSCSNRPWCAYKTEACHLCNTGLPVPRGADHHCNSCQHKFPSCASCNGYLHPRKGPRGPFLGCSNYPKCTQTRRVSPSDKAHTAPLDENNTPPHQSDDR